MKRSQNAQNQCFCKLELAKFCKIAQKVAKNCRKICICKKKVLSLQRISEEVEIKTQKVNQKKNKKMKANLKFNEKMDERNGYVFEAEGKNATFQIEPCDTGEEEVFYLHVIFVNWKYGKNTCEEYATFDAAVKAAEIANK